MKLNIKAMSLTIAIIWGLCLFCITWWVILLEGSNNNPNLLSQIYRGYSITPIGSFVGLIWALVDGAIVGACIAWIYNSLISKQIKANEKV